MSHRLIALRSTRSGSVEDLFGLGMSFRLMLSWGRLPPLKTMNEFLACGRDDTDGDEGLLQWEPFALTAAEYRKLTENLARQGHEVVVEDVRVQRAAPSYDEWFALHVAERSTKRKPRRK